MRSKQTFFTLSPDGLTQFSLDSTSFIDLDRLMVKLFAFKMMTKTIFYHGHDFTDPLMVEC